MRAVIGLLNYLARRKEARAAPLPKTPLEKLALRLELIAAMLPKVDGLGFWRGWLRNHARQIRAGSPALRDIISFLDARSPFGDAVLYHVPRDAQVLDVIWATRRLAEEIAADHRANR